MTNHWLINIDTGGTFTDCFAIAPDGSSHRVKVLSSAALRASIQKVYDKKSFAIKFDHELCQDFFKSYDFYYNPEKAPIAIDSYDSEKQIICLSEPCPAPLQPGDLIEMRSGEEAPVLAARLICNKRRHEQLPPMTMRLGTTRGTNCLLEHKGARVALFITKGFQDLLAIGNQQRPDLFALRIIKAPQLYERSIAIDERCSADGSIIQTLDTASLRHAAEQCLSDGIQDAAVLCLNSYRNSGHEEQVHDLLKECGFENVSISSRLSPFIACLPRAQTTVVNAYLTPVMSSFLNNISATLEEDSLLVMNSAGGLVQHNDFCPKDSLLSGPAGGVVGAAAAARRAGVEKFIGFDIGGTSADVCRFDGSFDYQFEHQVGEARLQAPALRIESIAAGGGSLCGHNDFGLFVGPESAGAQPGPAAYGAGGPLTLTDVQLLLGRLDLTQFGIPVYPEAAEEKLQNMIDDLDGAFKRDELLAGFLELAVEGMVAAIRSISVREGYHPSDYALLAFGGGGGQYACAVAEQLDMQEIICPADAGILSACGIAAATREYIYEEQLDLDLDDFMSEQEERMQNAEAAAVKKLTDDACAEENIIIKRRILDCRIKGQSSHLKLDWQPDVDIAAAFRKRYEEIFVYSPSVESRIEIIALHVIAAEKKSREGNESFKQKKTATPTQKQQAFFKDGWQELAVYKRDTLEAGDLVDGPAIVQDKLGTVLIAPQWQAICGSRGSLRLRPLSHRSNISSDPRIKRELAVNRLNYLVDEMGQQLRRTALSTNVKERLDYSCALLDADGRLITNAPHIPVHLGAMGVCTRAVMAEMDWQEGDMIITNHPVYGGSHLPDITVLAPVFQDGRCLAVLANRAHHAELGGSRPGSSPPNAKRLIDEGVLIPPFKYIEQHQCRDDKLRQIFEQAKWPSRNFNENLADIRAQVAACQKGLQLCNKISNELGQENFLQAMKILKERAARAFAKRLHRLPDKAEASQKLDDGTAIHCRIEKKQERLLIQLSADPHPGNFNATAAIVQSAVIYVIRLLMEEDIPLNEGLLEKVDIHIAPGMLNPDFNKPIDELPAVIAGNTETSQRLVDCLLKAFNVAACSQGTMNNFLFGNDSFGFYETICGGSGATADGPGADAVHSHMTNTSITDPEILEDRYPVRLRQFAIRENSGGQGQYPGGNGVIREFEFLAPMALSLLMQHRKEKPYGMNGGGPGKTGRQWIETAEGKIIELPGISEYDARAGDRLVIETPGGGAWGKA